MPSFSHTSTWSSCPTVNISDWSGFVACEPVNCLQLEQWPKNILYDSSFHRRHNMHYELLSRIVFWLRCRMSVIAVSYSAGPWLKSQSRHRLLKKFWFCTVPYTAPPPPSKVPGRNLKWGHCHFLSPPLHFIIK